ncbi:unnamed protein product [Plutella xylostella]|uniref:(diamondback moth) hypothetical protein n=1 Tax=Plutella xylostella TaxID=51655 RepID=A0A8S4EL37_PLUXY|nr:unnamed protein product [Plutella xylostella]
MNNYDVITVTESWLHDGIFDQELFDERYCVWRRDRNYVHTQQERGGGVLIAIKKELKAIERSDWNSSAEDLWISVSLRCPCFSDKLEYATTHNDSDKFLILGDFNMSFIKWISTECGLEASSVTGKVLLSLVHSPAPGTAHTHASSVTHTSMDAADAAPPPPPRHRAAAPVGENLRPNTECLRLTFILLFLCCDCGTSSELRVLNKRIKKLIRRDLRRSNTRAIEAAIEQNRGSKVFVQQLGRGHLTKMRSADGNIVVSKPEVLAEIEGFYGQLYASHAQKSVAQLTDSRAPLIRHYTDYIPDVDIGEIRIALEQLKNNKAPGEDGITTELLKAGGIATLEQLQRLFNSVLHNGITPEAWSESVVVLFFKKDTEEHNFDKEAARRIQLGWAAFGKLRHIFSSAIPQSLKTKVFNQCVLPVMTYGAETWTLTTPAVSNANGTKMLVAINCLYLLHFCLAAASAAAPAVTAVRSTWDGANVQTHVASHSTDRPRSHGIRVRPSGRFPSLRHKRT